MENTTSSKQSTSQITCRDIWLFGAPDDENVRVPMDLILSRKYWEEFLVLMRGDKQLATEFFSSQIHDRLDQMLGPGSGEPEVLNDILEAVRARHRQEVKQAK